MEVVLFFDELSLLFVLCLIISSKSYIALNRTILISNYLLFRLYFIETTDHSGH